MTTRPSPAWLAANRDNLLAWIDWDMGDIPKATRKILRKKVLAAACASSSDAVPARRGRGRPKAQLDREKVLEALRAANGSARGAAEQLDVPRSTLGRYLEREGVGAYYLYPAELRASDCALLAASGVSAATAQARGYHRSHAGLRIPLWTADGTVAWTQTRHDVPKHPGARYGNPPNVQPVVDVPPAGRELVLDVRRPLYVAESPRGADAAATAGLACVAIQGARMVCSERAQWEALGVRGRRVYVALDADASTNAEVAAAERQLVKLLGELGARVDVLRLSPLPGKPKAGLDDHLAAGSSERTLLARRVAR